MKCVQHDCKLYIVIIKRVYVLSHCHDSLSMEVFVWTFCIPTKKKSPSYAVRCLYNNEGTISKRSGLFQYEMKESDNLKMLFFS